MLPSTRLLISTMHSTAPIVRLSRPGYEMTAAGWRASPLKGPSAVGVRNQLIKHGLLASQRSLTPDADLGDDRWLSPMPQTSLKPTQRRILRALALGVQFNSTIGQFTISRQELHDLAFSSHATAPSTLQPEVSRLRAQLADWVQQQLTLHLPGAKWDNEARRIAQVVQWIGREEDRVYYLDPALVRVDWFEVLGALETAKQERDAYQRALALFMAHRAWVRSFRATPEHDLLEFERRVSEARNASNATVDQQLDLRYSRLTIGKRWVVRNDHLDALRVAGHSDRMVMEYRLMQRGYRNDLDHEPGGPDNGEPRGAFFGITAVPLPNEDSPPQQPLEFLGEKTLPGGRYSLTEAAAFRRPNLQPAPIGVLNRLSTRISRADASRPLDVTWTEMSALTVNITRQLADARGRVEGDERMLPVFDVIIAVGRGGALLATALCQILGVRLMGTLAMSRYAEPNSEKGTSPFIRGVEMPVVTARRVLVCDDVIKSGRTIEKALTEVVYDSYPGAEVHVVSYIGDSGTLNDKRANGGREDRNSDQWYAGLGVNLRQPVIDNSGRWLTFRWAPIEDSTIKTE